MNDRTQAGVLLTQKLSAFAHQPHTCVVAIPRGGVVVGRVLADQLALPLFVVVVKKIGAPNNPELAIGAVAPKGMHVVDEELVKTLGVSKGYLDRTISKIQGEISQRQERYMGTKKLPQFQGKSVILTDDGIATGATTQAAIEYIRSTGARHIILAVPVAPSDTIEKLQSLVDRTVVLEIPAPFSAVGQFYREFPQVSDEEVVKLLVSRPN